MTRSYKIAATDSYFFAKQIKLTLACIVQLEKELGKPQLDETQNRHAVQEQRWVEENVAATCRRDMPEKNKHPMQSTSLQHLTGQHSLGAVGARRCRLEHRLAKPGVPRRMHRRDLTDSLTGVGC